MLAYKFRNSAQFDCSLDIIFNQRLYCADWNVLNDAVEGAFISMVKSSADSARNSFQSKADDIVDETRKLKVCSLSRIFDSHLLWAHYASGFDGLAIEIDLPDNSPEITAVKYGPVFEVIEMTGDIDPAEAAKTVLSSKPIDWSYEEEIRILSRDKWFIFPNPVRRVIAGHRMKESLFKALRIICNKQGITLHQTGIGDEGIDADDIGYV